MIPLPTVFDALAQAIRGAKALAEKPVKQVPQQPAPPYHKSKDILRIEIRTRF